MPEDNIDHIDFDALDKKALSAPLVTHIYTADPSAHYFNGKIYIYPSHDIDAGEAFDDLGSHFGCILAALREPKGGQWEPRGHQNREKSHQNSM